MMKSIQFVSGLRRTCALLVAVAMAPGACASLSAQALPAAEASPISTGFSLPTSLGSLQYGISASQSFIWGYYGNSSPAASTNVTGDLAYLSNSKRHPFSLVLSGGHSIGERGEPSYSFVGVGFSQVASVGRWNFVLSDNVSYLPGTAASGLSGVPGVGDLGVNPIQITGDTVQGLLTNYSNRVTNSAAGSVSRPLTGKTSLNASGSYSTIRFIDTTLNTSGVSSAGLDDNSESGQGGILHQIDARSSFGANYAYSNYSYSNNNFGIAAPGFASQSVSGVYSHSFSRKLTASVSAGPQWTKVQSTSSVRSTSLFADASAAYAGKFASSSLSFVRSTDNGYGSLGGSISDGVSFSVNRRFGIVWNMAATSSFTRSASLPAPGIPSFSANTYVDGIQVSRALMQSLSCYASYTFEDQSVNGTGAINVYSGTSQVVGFGITYSPVALHLGRP